MLSKDLKQLETCPEKTTEINGGVASALPDEESLKKTPSREVADSQNRFPQRGQVRPLSRRVPSLENWSTTLQTVLDRPPVSLPQQMLLGSTVFSLAFVAWATFGTIEEVGRAQGRLVPKGETYKIHSTDAGKIVKLAIQEGQSVKAGQLLAELDPQIASTEVERLEKLLSASQMQLMQTQNLWERTRLEVQANQAIAAAEQQGAEAAIARARATVNTTELQIEQLQADVSSQEARRQRLEPLQKQVQALIEQLQLDVTSQQTREQRMQSQPRKSQNLLLQLQAQALSNRERVQRIEPLVEEGALSKDVLFQAEQALRESESAIIRAQLAEETQAREQVFEAQQARRDRANALLRSQLTEAVQVKERLFEAEQVLRDRQAAIGKHQGELTVQLAEVKRLQAEALQKQALARQTRLEKEQKIQQLAIEIAQLQSKIAETQTLLTSAKTKLKQKSLYAPVDGTVSFLKVSHAGEVVEPGQTLAEIAPHHAPLVLMANLPNQEAGFVKTGMPVQIKFDAYPYQNYGVIAGKIAAISPDAKPNEKFGPSYRVEIELDRDFVTANRQQWKLKAGQTASAEIVVRQRRVAEILLDPLKQLQKGGMTL